MDIMNIVDVHVLKLLSFIQLLLHNYTNPLIASYDLQANLYYDSITYYFMAIY